MRLKIKALPALILLLAAGNAQAQQAEELIRQSIEARGGAARLQRLQSVQRTGTIRIVGTDFSFAFTTINMRPNLVRVESSFEGQAMIEAYDGTTAWSINPLVGSSTPQRMPAGDAEVLIEQAAFDHPFLTYRERGVQVDYLGTEFVNAQQTHKLLFKRDRETYDIYFLDATTLLEVRKISHRLIKGSSVETVTDYENYRAVDGLQVPFHVELQGVQHTSIDIESVIFNKKIDPARFAMPAAGGKR